MTANSVKPFSRYASYVSEIFAYLKPMGILGGFYTRIYSDGSAINLASDAYWSEFYFKKLLSGAYENQDIVDQCFLDIGASLWALKPSNLVWQDARHFGYGNGITISRNTESFREFIGLYASINNDAINHFYLNNMDKVKNIRAHFLAQAADLIRQAEIERSTFATSIYPSGPMISTDNITHKIAGLSINLPRQRAQCLAHLAQGKSNKEIADAMKLSPRTIDHYLEILRKELGCKTSKELISIYASLSEI